MHQKTENRPIGGLDSDSENRLIADTDYRYAMNIRNSIGYDGQFGVLTNVKGNVLVDNYTLPNGTNKCIGSYYDKGENTTIYFVWNSNGEHLILRFYPNKKSNLYPLGTIQQIIKYNFGWSQDEFITGVELVDNKLLYWTDSVKPRKINIQKANITEKKKTWRVYLPINYVQTFQTWGWNLYLMDGTQIVAGVFTFTNSYNRQQAFDIIAQNINNHSVASQYIEAESCGCDLIIKEKQENQVYLDFAGNGFYKIVPDNWYGFNLIDRYFDRGKWQPLIQPLSTYKKDEKFAYNYVKNKVFQFRIQYIYDDGEESALGEWSLIPLNNIDCNDSKTNLLNYLEIDFNNQDAIDANVFVILKKVAVYYRENNSGNEKLVSTIDICDFYDGSKSYFNFYNNEIASAVSAELSAKQYDNIPIQSKALAYVKNKLIDANVKLNYDAPDCISATITQNIEEKPQQKFFKVKARITIFTPAMADPGYTNNIFSSWATWQDAQTSASGNMWYMWNQYQKREPHIYQRNGLICHDTSRTENDFAFYGGAGYGQNPGIDFGIRAGMETNFDQRIPEGGWALYSAGNPYFAVSKQNKYPLIQDALGAFDTSQEALRKALGNYFYPTQNNFAFSEVEFMVPEGTHVFRLASHFCSFGDKLQLGSVYDLNNGLAWQRTSTNVWGVYDYEADGSYEWKGQQKEIVKTITQDTYIGEFVVVDLAPNHTRNTENVPYTCFTGYLYDGNGRLDLNNPTWEGIPVEKSVITIQSYEDFNVLGQITQTNDIVNGGFGITDHNGYFYLPGTCIKNSSISFNIIAWSVTGNPNNPNGVGIILKNRFYSVFKGNLGALLNKTIEPSDSKKESVINSIAPIIIVTDNEKERNKCLTYVQGNILDSSGNGVSDVTVIVTGGQWRRTDAKGYFKIPVWGDATKYFMSFGQIAFNPNLGGLINANNSRDFLLIFNSPDGCDFETIENNNLYIITPYGENTSTSINSPPYSSTSIFQPINNFQLNYIGEAIYKARKRGASYGIGIRFYDEMTRRCKIIPIQNIYVPYTTEDVGAYLPNYPLGTFRYGIPTINWQLFDFPKGLEWAYKYEIVWTKNETWSYSLQWITGAVQYINKLQYQENEETIESLKTTYEASDATHLEIVIDLVSYYRQYGSTFISYEFKQGDVLRILRNKNGDFYKGVFEFEIVAYSITTQKITVKYNSIPFEITSGCVVEILRPRKSAEKEERIYYSSGELFYCTAPNTLFNDYSVKSGTFKSGDTYWRRRLFVSYNEITSEAQTFCYPLECDSISDFYESKSTDIGKPYILEPELKQAWFPTRFLISNAYDSTGSFNGLSEVELLSFKQLSLVFGEIINMKIVQNVLLSIHKYSIVSNYISSQTSANANGEDEIFIVSNELIGNERPLMQLFGSQNAESVVQWRNYVYGVDANMGIVWRYSQDGLNAISDYKLKTFLRNELHDRTKILGVFDEFNQEYLISLIGNKPALTVSFSEPKNRWVSLYSFIPEYYGQYGNKIVSFLNGRLWVHDENSLYNNFYGAQFQSELIFVVNKDNVLPKVWHTLFLELLSTANKNNWDIYEINNDNGQLSRLNKQSFIKKEAYYHAPYKRDLNTVGVSNPILNGRVLRSNMLVIKMRNDGTGLETLKGIVNEYQISERITN